MSKKKNTKVWKDEVINVRLTAGQKEELERVAATEGLGLSTWLLRLGLVEAQKKRTEEARR